MNNFDNIELVKNKFNWGAFLLTWIWGIFNKTYITFLIVPLALIPSVGKFISLICAIWFGINGNRWALKNKKFDSLEDFKKFQKKFVKIAIYLCVFNILICGIVFFLTKASMINSLIDIEIQKSILKLATFMVIFSTIIAILYLVNIKKIYKSLLTIIILLLVVFNIIPIIKLYEHKNFITDISDIIEGIEVQGLLLKAKNIPELKNWQDLSSNGLTNYVLKILNNQNQKINMHDSTLTFEDTNWEFHGDSNCIQKYSCYIKITSLQNSNITLKIPLKLDKNGQIATKIDYIKLMKLDTNY